MQAKPVIIVGAGPVGLGAALELTRFGVRSILLEKHETTSWHPKTRNFNTRTMEIAMGWGEAVYRRLRNIDTPPGWKTPIRFLQSATGEQFGSIESKGFEGPGADISPALPIMSSQDLIEEILLDAARASGLVDARFSTRATRILRGGEDGASGVVIEIENTQSGVRETLEGVALVAADGADSQTRAQLGLAMEGPTGLHHLVNCYFRADIEHHLGDRKGVLLFVNNSDASGVLQPLDAAGRWLCQIHVTPETWSLDHFDNARAKAWVRAAVGVADIEVDILSLGLWRLNATTVERFVQGRAILCGDAAHQFPPTGGLGVNTGLQGMHNVMWKLAAFVNGQAGWDLVRTYHDERHAVSREIVMQSFINSANVQRINAAAASGGESGLSVEEAVIAARRYGNHLGAEFGSQYASRAIVQDGTSAPRVGDSYCDYAPSATPGSRAPHVMLGLPENQLSTLHLFGANLTLLAASGGDDWRSVVENLAREFGAAVDCYIIGAAGLGDDGTFCKAYGLSEGGAVLVRPDGHIAMRRRQGPACSAALRAALAATLAREEVLEMPA